MSITDAIQCACSDTSGHATLADLRARLMRRMGWGAQVASPPPGVADMLTDFLQSAQTLLYNRPNGELRTERWFSWPLTAGVRKYDYPNNDEKNAPQSCSKSLNPRQVTWVGIELDGVWQPLAEGINPSVYSHNVTGRPERYEFRQCIELWPSPAVTRGNLVIKGRFELEPFAADTDKTTIHSELVFLLALSNLKAHYRQSDASSYVQQMEVLLGDIVAGSHGTARYIPGRDRRDDLVYVAPRPLVPFA